MSTHKNFYDLSIYPFLHLTLTHTHTPQFFFYYFKPLSLKHSDEVLYRLTNPTEGKRNTLLFKEEEVEEATILYIEWKKQKKQ